MERVRFYEMDHEALLIEQGVSKEHILQMKEIKVKNHEPLFWKYHNGILTKETMLVPLEKIKGITRCSPGFSWWDHFILRKGDLVDSRMESLLSSLKKKGLEEFRNTFIDEKYKVSLFHFVDHDIYFVCNDGNHRTIWAKIVGAPFIMADIERYEFPKDEENIKLIESIHREYLNLLNSMNLVHSEGEVVYKDQHVLPFESFEITDWTNTEQIRLAKATYKCNVIELRELIDLYIKISVCGTLHRKIKLFLWKLYDKDTPPNTVIRLIKLGWNLDIETVLNRFERILDMLEHNVE
ncbi:hypothetical protein [Laceyella putida]|uniref:Uncharacterized protein n=1 Tax=Laceyella putida TaxID=110101 RepID=A0ABW2RQ54_9BACL